MVHTFIVQTTASGDFFSALKGSLDAMGLHQTFQECFGDEVEVKDQAEADSLFVSCAKWGRKLAVVETPIGDNDTVSLARMDENTIYLHYDKETDAYGYLVLQDKDANAPVKHMRHELIIVDDEDNELEMVCGDELPSIVEVTESVEFETTLDLNDDQMMFHVMSLLTAEASNLSKNKYLWSRLAKQFVDMFKSRQAYDAKPFECKANRRLKPIIKGTKIYMQIPDDKSTFPDEDDENLAKYTTMDNVLARLWRTMGPYKDYERLSYEKEKIYTNNIAENDLPTKAWVPCRHTFALLYHPLKLITAFAPESLRTDIVGMVYNHPRRNNAAQTLNVADYTAFLAGLNEGDQVVQIDAMTGQRTKAKVSQRSEGGVLTMNTGKVVHANPIRIGTNDTYLHPTTDHNDDKLFFRGMGGTGDVAVFVSRDVDIEQALQIATPSPDDVVYHNKEGVFTVTDVEKRLEAFGYDSLFCKLNPEVAKVAIEGNTGKMHKAKSITLPTVNKGKKNVSHFFTRTVHRLQKVLQGFAYRPFSSKGTWRDSDYARMKELTSGSDGGTIVYQLLVASAIEDIVLQNVAGVHVGGAKPEATCKDEEITIKKTYDTLAALKEDNFKPVAGVGIGDYARVQDDDHVVFRRFKDGNGDHLWVKDMMFYHKQCSGDKDHVPGFKKLSDQRCFMDEIERVCRSRTAIQQENAERLRKLKQEMMQKAAWIKDNAESVKRKSNANLRRMQDFTLMHILEHVAPTYTAEPAFYMREADGGMQTKLDFSDLPHYNALELPSTSALVMDDWFEALMTSVNLMGVATQTFPYLRAVKVKHQQEMCAIENRVDTRVKSDKNKAKEKYTNADQYKAKCDTIDKQGKTTKRRLQGDEVNRYDKEKVATAMAVGILFARMRGIATSVEAVALAAARFARQSEEHCKRDIIESTKRFLDDNVDIAKTINNDLLVNIGVQGAYTEPWTSFKPHKPWNVQIDNRATSVASLKFGKTVLTNMPQHRENLFTQGIIALKAVEVNIDSITNAQGYASCQIKSILNALDHLRNGSSAKEFWNSYSDDVAAQFDGKFVTDAIGGDVERHRVLLLEYLRGEMRVKLGKLCNEPGDDPDHKTASSRKVEISNALADVDVCMNNIEPKNGGAVEFVVLVLLDMFAHVLNACHAKGIKKMLQDKCIEYMDRNKYDDVMLANERERLRELGKNKKIAYLESILDEDKKKEIESLLKMGLMKWEDMLKNAPSIEENDTAFEKPEHQMGEDYEEEPDATYQGYFDAEDDYADDDDD